MRGREFFASLSLKGIIVSISALMISLWPGEVESYKFERSSKTGRAYHWKRSRFPIPLLLDRNGSADLNFNQVKSAITAAINTWNNVNCSAAKLQLSGISPGLPAPKYDGKNVLKFLKTANEWRWSPLEFAKTMFVVNLRTGEILDTDLVFNDWKFTWGTDGSANKADLQATATHEMGHILGLAHSNDPTASMYARANVGETGKRKLAQDDIKGICELYPVQPCDEGKEVGGKLVCYNGRFVPICAPYYGDLCKDCSNGLHAACGGERDFCLQMKGYKKRCGLDCSATKSCPRGYTCVQVLGDNKKVLGYNCIPDNQDCDNPPKLPCCRNQDDCLPGYSCINSQCVRGKTCAKEGESCGGNQSCCNKLKCVDDGTGSRCRKPCDPLAPRCEGTLRCASIGGSTTEGACVPPRGRGKEGDKCDRSKPCEYELECDPQEKRCRYLCRPKQSGTCPNGYYCKPMGDPNNSPGLCFKAQSGRNCTTTGDCPTGQVCKNKRCAPCTRDSDCPVRHICQKGRCLAKCLSSAECPRQHRCDQGLCQPGIPCTSDRDCTGGLVCSGGICNEPSNKSCNSDADCGTGKRCVNGICRLPDACNNKCASDEVCVQGTCVPQTCQSDSQCGDGFICRNSRCHPEVKNCGGQGPCPEGTECINNRCVGKIGYGCTGDEECSSGLTCVKGGKLKICTKLCNPAQPKNCPNGYFCAEVNNVGYACWPATQTECKDNVCRPIGEGCGCQQIPPTTPWFPGILLLFLLPILKRNLQLKLRKSRRR